VGAAYDGEENTISSTSCLNDGRLKGFDARLEARIEELFRRCVNANRRSD
jgi:hypothetical protein